MPHDDGRAAAAGASVKAMHIASADGTRLNPYQNLVGLNGRVCDVLVSQFVICVHHKRFHNGMLLLLCLIEKTGCRRRLLPRSGEAVIL